MISTIFINNQKVDLDLLPFVFRIKSTMKIDKETLLDINKIYNILYKIFNIKNIKKVLKMIMKIDKLAI